MPTPREVILAGPYKLDALSGIIKLNYLFENFRHYALHTAHWSYLASGRKPDGGLVTPESILDGTNQGVVYCDPLVQAFMALGKHACPELAASIRDVALDPCLLATGLTCIDPGVVGNVCTLQKSYADVRQCLFSSKHVVCSAGQVCYDVCFLTKIPKPDFFVEIEGFSNPSHYEYPDLEGWRISRKPPHRIFRPAPKGWPQPKGFDVGFIEVAPSAITPGELKALKAFAAKTPSLAHAFK